ncbi:MAG: EF-hand domain-containing protein [Candidatus Gastranaerophilales bacterium]|nr:EF-hand domain-containing protein [Candidatus Gastranaerophilales bacterium]
MANLIGSSLFTSAISGLNSNYLLLLNGASGLTLDNILHPQDDAVKYTVNQTFRSYMMNNFNSIDIDGDGQITTKDVDKYVTKLKTQGMTYQELTQLCSTSSGSMSSLLDTVLSNFNEIDANHDGRITQGEINAYRINDEIKDMKEEYPKIDPTKMSMFYDSQVANSEKTSQKEDKVFG